MSVSGSDTNGLPAPRTIKLGASMTYDLLCAAGPGLRGRIDDRTGKPRVGNAEDEFDSFVRARTHALLRSAYLLTGDQQLAEDLVQSALTRTHQAWQRLEHTGNAEAYARRTMYHLQGSWWRRRRVAEVMPERMPDQAGSADHAGAVSLRLAVKQALLQLTARQRAVLVLRFFEDCTESDAADLLGISIGTVKSQTAKALARLRTIAPELADLDSRNGALS